MIKSKSSNKYFPYLPEGWLRISEYVPSLMFKDENANGISYDIYKKFYVVVEHGRDTERFKTFEEAVAYMETVCG